MKFYSPLRYPGGKGKLAPFLQRLYDSNCLGGGCYVEPFAGGASVAISLLFNEYVKKIVINDLDRSIFAFWHSILNCPNKFCKSIQDAPLNTRYWKEQKAIQKRKEEADLFELGFSTFYLNRTNRSGILNGGIIGGLKQVGAWKIDARFNKDELIRRIQKIAEYRDRIDLYNLDACDLVKKIKRRLPAKTLFYFDPPYYIKGKDLYHNYFKHGDHEAVARMIRDLDNFHWIVSYDNTPEIKKMYRGFKRLEYSLDYCASTYSKGKEVIFVSKKTLIPRGVRPIKA